MKNNVFLSSLGRRLAGVVFAVLCLAGGAGVVRAADKLYYLSAGGSGTTAAATDTLRVINTDGTGDANVYNADTIANPNAFAIDLAGNRAFVADSFNGLQKIYTVNLSTGAVAQFLDLTGAPYTVNAMEIDRTNSKLYYLSQGGSGSTPAATDTLRVINLDGTGDANVFNASSLANPNALALDIANNRAFVADSFNGLQKIYTVNLSTGAVASFLDLTAAPYTVASMKVDTVNSKLYYLSQGGSGSTAASTDALRVINLNGTGDANVFNTDTIANPNALALDLANNRAFVADSFNGIQKIYTVNLSTGAVASFLDLTAAPYTVAAMDLVITPPSITSSLTASGTYGAAISTYTITASGSPSSYNATGLPTGLSINTGNGQITGTPTQSGSFSVTISATNLGGTGSATLVMTIAPAVTNVTSSTTNGTKKIGDTVSIQVVFSSAVTVTNTPALALNSGGTATYSSGSGAATLNFTYTVGAGESASDLDYSATNSLTLPGGATIKGAGNANASLTLPTVGGANSIAGQKALVIDGIAPSVSNRSVPANGTYIVGQNLDFTVTWSENVIVNTSGGTPSIAVTLDTGGTVAAAYSSGSGGTTLTFRYTVASGNLDSNGVAVGTSISLNGGTILDGAGNAAALTSLGFGSTAGVLVDGVAPTVANRTVPANGTYKAGDNLDFTVTYSENVAITGAPYLPVTLDTGGTVHAVYFSATSTVLTFRYTVTAGDLDTNGIAVASSITLNGGTIKDTAGNDAATTSLGFGSTAGVLVDAVAPTVSSINRASTSPTNAVSVDFTVTFSEAVSGVDTSDFALTLSGVTASVASVTPVSGAVYTVTVNSISGDGTVRLDLNNAGTGITDTIGNAIATGFTGGQSYTIDQTAPTTTVATAAFSADTGTSSTDFITKTAAQTISGTLSANIVSGELVEVSLDNGSTWSTATTSVGANTWSLSTTLTASNTLKVRVSDTAGNHGTVFSQAYVLDTTAPTTTIATAAFSADTGISSTDFVTMTAAQDISGTLSAAMVAGEFVEVSLDNGSTWATASTTVGQSTWSLAGQTLTASNTLKVRVTDTAGNSGTTFGQAYVLDTTAPTAPTSVAVTAVGGTVVTNTLNGTNTNLTGSATITAGEATGGKAELYVGATLLATDNTIAGGDTSVTFSLGTASTAALQAAVTAGGTVSVKLYDLAGNNTTSNTGNPTLVVDYVAPTTTIATAAFSADTGTSSTDFITKTAAQTISGTLSANLAAGESVEVSLDNGSTWTSATASVGSSAWSLSTTLTASNTLKVRVSDTAGNSGTTFSQAYVLDTTAPTTTIATAAFSADTGTSSTDFVTMTAAQTISGTTSANMVAGEFVEASLDNGSTWTTASTTVGQNTWSLSGQTLTASNTLKVRVSDTAGNNGAALSQAYVFDTTAPTAPTAVALTPVGGVVVANTLNGTNTNLTASATITAAEATGGKAELYIGATLVAADNSIAGGDTSVTFDVGTATTAALQAAITAGGVATVKLYDLAGNATTSSVGNPTLVVDYAPPTATIATAAFSADTGTSATDFVTMTAAQTISGTTSANMVAGEIVEVSLNNGSTWATAATSVGANTWSLAGQTLTASNTLKVRVSDTAGNNGATLSQAYVLDTTAPTAPTAVALTPVGGVVVTNTLNGTNTNLTASATITAAEATGGKAELYVGATLIATDSTIAGGDTSVTFDLGTSTTAALQAAISAGGVATVKLYDLAGNATTSSVANPTLTIDYVAPTATIATAAFSADTGTSATDFVTMTAAQTISGTTSANMVAGEIVEVSLNNGSTWATATTSVGANTWSLAGQTLTASNTLKVRVSDTAGNSGTTFSQAYVFDTTAPTAPTAVTLTPVGGVVVANTLNGTNTNLTASATITAAQATGGKAELYIGATLIATDSTIAGGDTSVTFDVGTSTTAALQAAITAGGVATVKLYDLAGNSITSSVANPTLVVDYVVPAAPTGVALTPVGGSVVANTLNGTNTNLTATATITAGQATGGKAELYIGATLVATDSSIAGGDTSVTFDVGATTNPQLQTAVPAGGVATVKLYDAAGNSVTSSVGNPTLIVTYTPPTAPTAVALTPVGGTIVANTLNGTNTNLTATATITAGQATGGKAELYIGATLIASDLSIAGGDTSVTFSVGTSTTAGLQAAVTAGGVATVKLYDSAGNTSTSSVGNPTLIVDYTAPAFASILRQTPLTVNSSATSVTWRVTFGEGVTGVDASDFALTVVSGTPTGAIGTVTPVSTSVYDVTVGSIVGQGRLRLDLKTTGTGIKDIAGNVLPDGGFTGGDFYYVGVTNVFDTVALATGTTRSVSGATTNKVAQRFTTAGSAPLSLTTVIASLGTVTGTPVPVVKVYNDNSGAVGSTVITTLTNPSSLTANALNVWTSTTLLTASTTYWVVFDDTSAAGAYNIKETAATSGGAGTWLNSPADYFYFYGAGGATGPQAGALQIAIGATSTPSITSPLIASAGYGSAFTYNITATNLPNSYAASGLPSGLILNASSGLISGTPTQAGTFPVSLTGTNGSGVGVPSTLVLTVVQAQLTITAQAQTRVFGAANPAFTLSYTGFIGTDTVAALTQLPVLQTNATTASPPGNYQITFASGATAANYFFVYVPGVLTVTKATATVTLSDLTQAFTGSPRPVTVTTNPAGLSVAVTYDGSPTAPSAIGSYTVVATVNDPNYQGTATGMLTIGKTPVMIALGGLSATYDGSAKAATATTTPSGLPVTITYNGSATAPTNAGSYAVVATVNTATQAGMASGTLVVAKANQSITFAPLADKTTSDRTPNVSTVPLSGTATSGLPVSFALVSGPATVSGTTLSLTGEAGFVTVRASQGGNENFNAATDVMQAFTVVAAGPRIFVGDAVSSGTDVGDIGAVIPPTGGSGALLLIAPSFNLDLVLDFTLQPDGTFVSITSANLTQGTESTTAAVRTLTLHGQLVGNILSGHFDEIDLSFAVTVQGPGSTTSVAGFYESNNINSATGGTFTIVGNNGEVISITDTGTGLIGGRTTLKADGTFTTTSGNITVNGRLDAANDTVSGTITRPGMPDTTFTGVVDTVARTDRVINLSSRARIGPSGDRTLITGFVIGGTQSKRVLLRAIGPTLANYGVTGVLSNPKLQLFDSNQKLIYENDDWSGADTAAAIAQTGAFALPAGSRDAALVVTLAPGAYTMHIIDGGEIGVAMAEIYDASTNPGSEYQRLINISSRGTVESGDGTLIGGFVVTGNAPKRVLVRGVGPTLVNYGVATALADPKLVLFSGQTVIAQNDNWETPTAISANQTAATAADITAAGTATGAFKLPAGSKDAAIVITLAPGVYTAQVASATGQTGVALVEIYEIPE